MVRIHRILATCILVGLVVCIDATPTQAEEGGNGVNEKAQRTFAPPFRKAPWSEVLDWLADITGMPVVTQYRPTGTVSFGDWHLGHYRYTVAEIIELLNESLLDQGFFIIRRQATIGIYPVDEPLPGGPFLTWRVEELADKTRTEVGRLIYPLKSLRAEVIAPTVKKLLSPFGHVVALEDTNLLILIDTAASLRIVADTLADMEEGRRPARWRVLPCRNCLATDVAEKLKKALHDPHREHRGKSVIIITHMRTNTVLVRGPLDKVVLARGIVEQLDAPPKRWSNAPVLKTYYVPRGQAAVIAKVLQQAYQSAPNLRFVVVGNASVIVHAAPADHANIALRFLLAEARPR